MARQKKAYPEDGKTMFGLSTMGWADTIATSFITGLFMLYLTDYANIGAYAATLGTTLLLIGRIIDMVDDPVQGWIMDRTRPTKIGKYKPFMIISIILITLSMCFLFSVPQAIVHNTVLTSIWVIFFYLLYDIGTAFNAQIPLKQSLTTDPRIRARHMTWPRVVSMIVVIPMSFFIAMVTGLNSVVGNMSRSFSLMAVIIALIAGIVSLIGIGVVKEGKHMDESREEKITFKEIASLFVGNKPFLINTVMTIFHGFVWTMVFATTTYYIKWAYCTDLSTGVVDQAAFGTMTMIMGIFQLVPSILGAAISPKLVKIFDGPVKVFQIAASLELIGGAGLFIAMMMGVLNSSPVLYFILIFILLMGAGLTFVPGSMMGVECMDYAMVKVGREMHGIFNSVSSIISKAQAALSSALVGAVLIAIGYEVDSATDTFLGELSAIPDMLRSFIVISGLVPAILCVITLICLKLYPIDSKMRSEINEKIAEMRNE